MAILKTTVIAQPSGSLGGIVFSHNRGGQYMRNRSIPTNPNSIFQQTVRAAMASLAARWTDTLTAVQRLAWDTYAENVPLPNRVGDPINVGGLGMYVRSNVPRIQFGLAVVDDAPTTFNLGEWTAPGITSITASTSVAIITFEEADAWLDEDGSAMLIWDSDPKSPGVNYFKGPYKPSGTILGDAVTPLTSPQNVNLTHAPSAGNKTFLKMRVTRADGRLSSIFRDGLVAI